MLQYMETVSQGEAENIRKTIQDLFRQTCILQVKCDPATLVQHDNPRYQVCLRHREFIADYLSVLDCELVHDPQEHIFRITGDGVMTERMSLMTTKLVILLKMIYRDKIMGEGLHATTTNLAEIREYGKKYKPYYKTSHRTGVERCTCPNENASDDRTAGSRCQSGRFYPDLYLQHCKCVLLGDGYQRAGAHLSGRGGRTSDRRGKRELDH